MILSLIMYIRNELNDPEIYLIVETFLKISMDIIFLMFTNLWSNWKWNSGPWDILSLYLKLAWPVPSNENNPI